MASNSVNSFCSAAGYTRANNGITTTAPGLAATNNTQIQTRPQTQPQSQPQVQQPQLQSQVQRSCFSANDGSQVCLTVTPPGAQQQSQVGLVAQGPIGNILAEVATADIPELFAAIGQEYGSRAVGQQLGNIIGNAAGRALVLIPF